MDHTPHMPGWRVTGTLFSDRAGTVYEICREHDPSVRATLKVISIPPSSTNIHKQLENGCTKEALHNFYLEHAKNISEELSLLRRMQKEGAITGCEEFRAAAHPGGIGCQLLIRSPLLTPLSEYARTHPLSDEDILRLGLDICDAMMLCAKEQIVHGAIEPDSIFVTADGHFKLGNFGAAKISDAGTDAYSYMSPEIYSRRPTQSSSDLYAFGLVLYELLNGGCLPFLDVPTREATAEQRNQALTERISGTPLPRPTGGTKMLQEVVLAACQYDPEQRFSSPAALRGALLASQEAPQPMPSAPAPVFDPVPTPQVYVNDRAADMPPAEDPISEPASSVHQPDICPSEQEPHTAAPEVPIPVPAAPVSEDPMSRTALYIPVTEILEETPDPSDANLRDAEPAYDPNVYLSDEDAPTVGPFSDQDFEAYDPYAVYDAIPTSETPKQKSNKILWIILIVLGILILAVGGYLLWDVLSLQQ